VGWTRGSAASAGHGLLRDGRSRGLVLSGVELSQHGHEDFFARLPNDPEALDELRRPNRVALLF
jgi:hypothetical protein